MPWEITENDADCGDGTPWGVRNTDSGELENCHASREEAQEQAAELNSAEDTDEEAGAQFEAVLVVEGEDTTDDRIFELNSVVWRNLPITLMAMTEGEHGGMASPVSRVAGHIDEIFRDPDADGVIRGRGRMSSSPFGKEVEKLIRERSLQRVSIDASLRFSDVRSEAITVDDDGFVLDERTVFSKATILMATVVPASAFSPTHIWLEGMSEPAEAAAAEGGEVEPIGEPEVIERDDDTPSILFALTASSGGPAQPPRAWFEQPEPDHWQPFVVEPDGRCYGHVAPFGRCHVGYQLARGVCRVAQRSSPGIPFFHVGRTLCDDGTHVPTGPLTMDAEHPDQPISYQEVQRHYAHTGTGVADLRCTDGEIGIWACGSVRPGLSDRELRTLSGTAPSIDQRPIDHQLELAGILMVNQPGLPKPRWAMSNGEQLALVAAAAVRCDDGELRAPVPLDLEQPPIDPSEIEFTPWGNAATAGGGSVTLTTLEALENPRLANIERRLEELTSLVVAALGEQALEHSDAAMRTK